MVAHAQAVSNSQGTQAVVFQRQQQLQPMQLRLSHQTKPRVEVDTIIHRKLKTISQLVHQAQLDILHSDHRPVLASQVQQAVDNHIQEHKRRQRLPHIQEHKFQQQALHTRLLVKRNDQLVKVLCNDQLQSEVSKDLLQVHSKDQLQEDLEIRVEMGEAAVDLRHQANKMRAKKEITQQFPENQMLTIQSTRRFQKLHSIVTNKNSQAITLTLKLAAKFSIFAL